MVGSVHPVQTIELMAELERIGYDGAIYFDTFPDQGGADPVAEAETNIALTERLRAVAAELAASAALAEAVARQDAPAATRIVARAPLRFSAMIDVLVAGSLHLDVVVDAPRLPRLDETLMGRSVAYRLGGKGGNQAIAAARMGARTAMAGRVGSDRFSAQILAELDAAGVDRPPGRTGKRSVRHERCDRGRVGQLRRRRGLGCKSGL